jgi:hypothetical protein
MWTWISLGESGYSENWQFKRGGVIKYLKDDMENNSWVQNGNSVTVEYYDNYSTYELEIINPKLMRGTFKNTAGYEGPTELRRK